MRKTAGRVLSKLFMFRVDGKISLFFLLLISFSIASTPVIDSEYEYLDADGETVRLKDPNRPNPNSVTSPVKDASSRPDSSGFKSITKYQLKSKGMSIKELDADGISANNGKRYAVVVGINDYKDVAFSDLSKARNDAKAVGKTLKEQGQFDEVFIMTDDIDFNGPESGLYPTKLNIEEKLDSILRFANPEDLIVFFFSGHGISDYDENGYLVVVDTVADKAFNSSLKVDEIVQKFKKKSIRKTLIMLDACRDVLYKSKSAARNSIREKRFEEAEVSAVFYSTKAGFYSYEDDDSDYGVFTKYLIYGMEGKADENKDGVISFSELENYVQDGVKGWSLQKNKQQKPYTRLNSEKTGDLAITIADNPEKSLVDKKVPSPSRWPFVWRSALLPGWGQFEEGNSKKGTAYFGVNALLFANFISARSNYSNAQRAYNSQLGFPAQFDEGDTFMLNYLLFKPRRDALNSTENVLQNATAALFGFWIWNIADAYIFKNRENQWFQANLEIRKNYLPSGTASFDRFQAETQYYIQFQFFK